MRKWIAILIACMIVMTMIGARVERVAALEPPACAVEHRTAATIVESAGSGDESIPIPEAIPYSAPEGIPADPATIERVTVLAESLVGCVNGGDIVGFMSLLSNDFLRRHFSDFDLSLEEITQLAATPTPLDEQLVLVAISDVTELPDGRIGVLVLLDQGEIESPELNSLLTLVETEGHLLIDEWQPVLIERGGEGDGLQVVCGEGDGWQMVCGEGYEGVIVPADQVGDFMRGLMGTPVQGSWTPTPEQIATLESTLPTYLKSAPNAAADLHERVGDYQRQYAGYVTEGRALIMVNAFCSSPGADWTSQPVFVADGGDCFFSVSYEPASGSFEDLRINGDA